MPRVSLRKKVKSKWRHYEVEAMGVLSRCRFARRRFGFRTRKRAQGGCCCGVFLRAGQPRSDRCGQLSSVRRKRFGGLQHYRLGGVADFGGYTNGHILATHTSGTFSTYLFGPRVSYRHYSRITPFEQVLFGVAHGNAAAFGTANTQNAFAMTTGGGVDYKLLDHFSVRPVYAEYLMTRFGEGTLGTRTQDNLRVSTGFLFRF
jgi:opacity protein-like surface antigen